MATIIKDNLTSQQRRLLYDAENYQVREMGDGQWLALHTEVPAAFSVARIGRGTVNVVSNTLNEHTVTFADNTFHCTCEDHRQHPERSCKHIAAGRAVAAHQQQKRQRADAKRISASIEADAEMSARAERNRQMVAGQIAEKMEQKGEPVSVTVEREDRNWNVVVDGDFWGQYRTKRDAELHAAGLRDALKRCSACGAAHLADRCLCGGNSAAGQIAEKQDARRLAA